MMRERRSPIWHPFTQHAVQPEMTRVVHADGTYLYTADGRQVINSISSCWVVTHKSSPYCRRYSGAGRQA